MVEWAWGDGGISRSTVGVRVRKRSEEMANGWMTRVAIDHQAFDQRTGINISRCNNNSHPSLTILL
jgi:hypothetical protein